MTEYVRPSSLSEALSARAAHPDYTLLSGGTDLLVGSKNGPRPRGVIDLFGLDDLRGIREEGRDLVIGAATTYREILASELVRTRIPMLAAAAREIGALQIQARGTMGGNMGTSSPVGDTLPVLLAADAIVELASARGRRSIAYDEFCTGYRTTALAPDELIAAIRFPRLPSGTTQHWRKMGTRKAQSISKVMVALAVAVDGSRISYLRIGLGAVAATPIRARGAEAVGLGKSADESTANAVRDALMAEIRPIDDVRSTASYRARVAGNAVRRFLLSVGEKA